MLSETDLSKQAIAEAAGVSRWTVRRIFESAKAPTDQQPG
jgi:DNA-binding transcriptional regulator LsrR (DeoR family)